MKKIFCLVFALVVSSVALSSCTKEDVKPLTPSAPGGGIKE